MKTCDEYKAMLSAYLDGEAGGEEGAISAHVASCDACRTILESLRHVSQRLRDLEEAPTTLAENIRRRVRTEGPRRRRKPLIPRFAAAAAIVAASLWGAVLLTTAKGDATRLSEAIPSGNLSETEQRILYGNPPSQDEWMAIVLTGGTRR